MGESVPPIMGDVPLSSTMSREESSIRMSGLGTFTSGLLDLSFRGFDRSLIFAVVLC
jgi:hypothetical protein